MSRSSSIPLHSNKEHHQSIFRNTLHYAFSSGSRPKLPILSTYLGLHLVLPLTISPPPSKRSKCWHSTKPGFAESPASLSTTEVRDCSTLSLMHSLLYSKVIPASSCVSKIGNGALCNKRNDPLNGTHVEASHKNHTVVAFQKPFCYHCTQVKIQNL